MKSIKKHFIQQLKQVVFSSSLRNALPLAKRRCLGCHQAGKWSSLLCDLCLEQLPWIHERCWQCGYPLATSLPVCGHCMTMPMGVSTACLFRYESPVSDLIHAFKYQRHLGWGAFFGQLLAHRLHSKPKPEVLIPIPSPFNRMQKRGFNPAMELSLAINRLNGLPVVWDALGCKPRAYQAQLRKEQRFKSVRRAFYAKNSVMPYKHVALVDDVVTTTATVHAVSEVLFNQGVTQIDVYAIARTVK